MTLRTAGARTLTVRDTGSGINGTANVTVNPATANHLGFSTPASTTAGSPFSVTVTARDQFNNVVPSYNGTVTFTSSDPHPATLPADYPFNPAVDHGVHTFSGAVILYTAPAQTVTATGAGVGSQTATVTVNPAALDHFGVTTSVDGGSTVAGSPFDVTVTAQDAFNNTVTGCTGTVTFSSADPYGATFSPPSYTFQPGDQGSVTLPGAATLYTAGTWDVTATDGDGFTGSDFINVTAAPAVALVVSAPDSAMTGVPIDFSVTATDPYGNTDPNYADTVTFSSMDPAATFSPPSYTFGPGDMGTATFAMGCTFGTVGTWDLTATDTGGLTGSATVNVPAIHSGGRQRMDLAEAAVAVRTAPVQPLPAAAAGTLPRDRTPEQPLLAPGRVDRLFADHGTSPRLAVLRAKPHDLDAGFIELIDQDTW